MLRQSLGDGATDPPAAASDKGGPPREVEQGVSKIGHFALKRLLAT
jgi:hypothetical protein